MHDRDQPEDGDQMTNERGHGGWRSAATRMRGVSAVSARAKSRTTPAQAVAQGGPAHTAQVRETCDVGHVSDKEAASERYAAAQNAR